ncbi:hypothetical protein GF325_06075 [Candidatus Bathyarchaeota archaeon]|nr:hypothetical protein [Candidatus Bathyarchaeota archaeon]
MHRDKVSFTALTDHLIRLGTFTTRIHVSFQDTHELLLEPVIGWENVARYLKSHASMRADGTYYRFAGGKNDAKIYFFKIVHMLIRNA